MPVPLTWSWFAPITRDRCRNSLYKKTTHRYIQISTDKLKNLKPSVKIRVNLWTLSLHCLAAGNKIGLKMSLIDMGVNDDIVADF